MQFFTPRNIVFGRGTREYIKKWKRGKTVIITGQNVWKGVKNKIEIDAQVHRLKRRTKTGEPLMEDIDSITDFLMEEKPQTIVAIGGGSVIDSSKIGWAFYEGKNLTWDDIFARKIPKRKKVRFIAVETTSGTGTGISAAAVVTGKDKLKVGIVHEEFIADYSIYDPDLVMSMPRKTAIYTGMDALTHAIEAYTSNIDNIPADTLALKAIDLIYHNLERAVNGDEKAREFVHYGNMLAAMGFTNSRLGLCHAASHKIGGRYKIEHGKINAILLPYVIRCNENYTNRFKDIAKIMGVDDVVMAIKELNDKFEIPDRYELKNIDKLAEEIENDALMNYNPRKMSRRDIIDFLLHVTKGEI